MPELTMERRDALVYSQNISFEITEEPIHDIPEGGNSQVVTDRLRGLYRELQGTVSSLVTSGEISDSVAVRLRLSDLRSIVLAGIAAQEESILEREAELPLSVQFFE